MPKLTPVKKATSTYGKLQMAQAKVDELRGQFATDVAAVSADPNSTLRAVRAATGLSTVSLTKWAKKGQLF